jgi:hypothetical protein
MRVSADRAAEIRSYADYARQLEGVLMHTENVLNAISHGGLLHAAPSDSADYDSHCAATGLLDLLSIEVSRVRNLPGTDLSVSLDVMAKEIAEGKMAVA